MTPEQAQKIDEVTQAVTQTLHSFYIPSMPTDDAEANQIIADARNKLHALDMALFGCFRIMEKYRDFNRPYYPAKQAFTLDDL